jgi:hypothetical protein
MAADAMRTRAEQVRATGCYLGLFDFVAWSVRNHVQVQMLFGSAIVDLQKVFAPDMPSHSVSCLRVAAVRCAVGVEHWLSAVGPGGEYHTCDVNHYVIGVAADPAAVAATGYDGVAGTSLDGDAALPLSTSARKNALRVGWMLRETVADGDCGIDCMSYHLRQDRTLADRNGIRSELGDFIKKVADDKAWQDVFCTCQEMPQAAAVSAKGSSGPPNTGPAAGETKPSGSSSSSSSSKPPMTGPAGSSASSSSGPPMTGPAAKASKPCAKAGTPLASKPLPPAASATSSSLAPPPLPPPAEESLVDVAAAAVAVAGPRAFREWLASRSVYQLNELTRSSTAFQDAEAQWRREELKAGDAAPIRRRNVSTKLNLKYATALSYSKWKAGPGEASRTPHKDFKKMCDSFPSYHTPSD